MAKTYEWSAGVAAAIAGLPPQRERAFWALVEGRGVLPPEVLAYLVRDAHSRGDRSIAERLFATLYDRYAAYVAHWSQAFATRLDRAQTSDDMVIGVFTTLWNRLCVDEGPTFYEACFLRGLKRLTQDKLFRLPDEGLVSLTIQSLEGDEDEQVDMPDHDAPDPQQQVELEEQRAALRTSIPAQLHALPARVQQAARLLMEGKTEGEVAKALGVSTRMITNYKATLRQALVGQT